ncbi:MAG TPA: HD domain-containing phosphohydrolase, partial [Dehalococcoidia bacterium]|nr:HD domain-containing phosphohydrolase [Dehalococcoidia bacterium]
GAVVGRYGGDEFVAVLPGADRAAAEAYRAAALETLLHARVSDPETGTLIPVVASVGLAVYPEEADAVEDLIRLADSAMYASRRLRVMDGEAGPLGRSLGPDRAERMVAEILPLLTSPGHLGDKLRLVSHRLSVGAGYDGVTFALIEGEHDAGTNAFSYASAAAAPVAPRGDRALNDRIAGLLRSQRRPIIIDDVAGDDRLSGDERAALESAGMRAVLLTPMLWQDELIGALSVASKRPAAFSVRDAEFVAAVATQVTAIVRMASMLDELRASSSRLMRAHTETVLMLAGAAEAHDHGTGRHLQRVRGLTEALALELGKSPEQAHELGLAAVLHDIGKIRVPDIVLGSSAKLAESEWLLMKQHTIWGSEFLAGQQGFALAAEVAHWHHERWDGTGYPDALAGDAIPESAQITAVADAFDAMTNDRPYRLGRPIADAVAELLRCSGTQFSPRVVDALARLHERTALSFVEIDLEDNGERAA